MAYKIEVYEDPLKLSVEEFERYLISLPSWRRIKVLSYRNQIDRNLSLLAYVLLCRGLYKWYGIEVDKTLNFEYNQNGKPYLADYPHIHFNISHCSKAVACVFSRDPIGVDVEELIEYDDLLLQRVANREECDSIVNAENPILAFTTLWTKKESYLKMTGEGLVDDLHSVLVEKRACFKSIYSESKKYVLTICESDCK